MVNTLTKKDTERLERIFGVSTHGFSREDRDLITRGYLFAKHAHFGQKRLSGRQYIVHPVQVSAILAGFNLSALVVTAGLIHDVLEDTEVTTTEICDAFGEEILFMVQGVTKLGKLKYRGLKRHTESLRRLFVAMSQDVRVVLIKLADRLHNMRTLDHLPAPKQRRIALETLEIYAPIAHRLGIGALKGELEDLAFLYIDPEAYTETKEMLEKEGRQRMTRLERIAKTLRKKLAADGMRDFRIDYRIKHIYSLYRKLERYDGVLEKVYDVAALRIVVRDIEQCYRVLGRVHSIWTPLPGRIKDYIAAPKGNGYQSLHTSIFTGDGAIVEVQIRTKEMHEHAEFGVASHVGYKEGDASGFSWVRSFLGLDKTAEEQTALAEERLKWIRELNEAQDDLTSPQAFIKALRGDIFNDRIFVFTPMGEVVDLPVGASPIDFAYTIHSDIGDHVSGAKINSKLVSLDTAIESGDIVEIITKESARPSYKWLDMVQTNNAKRKIRSALDNQKK